MNKRGTGCVKRSDVVSAIQDFDIMIETYNYDSLAAVDSVLAQMAAKGMKAIISPHDGNDIHDSSTSGNGCDIYCQTYGTSFYSNCDAQAQYDARGYEGHLDLQVSQQWHGLGKLVGSHPGLQH